MPGGLGFDQAFKPIGERCFAGHDSQLSFLREIVVVNLFIVHGFDNAHADRMKDHQPREFVAIDQNDLIRMTLGKLFSGLREIRGRYENPFRCFVCAKTATEIPSVRLAHGVVGIISFRLYIDSVEPQLILIYDPIYPAVAGLAERTPGIIS